MALPQDVLARLASLSGYDQMLEMDAVSRTHGVGLAEIESQIAAYKAGANSNKRPIRLQILTRLQARNWWT